MLVALAHGTREGDDMHLVGAGGAQDSGGRIEGRARHGDVVDQLRRTRHVRTCRGEDAAHVPPPLGAG
jgi:hypothetical protein